MAKPTIANRLDVARAELAATSKQIAELEAARNSALLADDDRTAVKLAGQADDLRRLARGYEDKIGLLEAEAEREANERRVKEKLGLIERIERKLAERDAAAAELQTAIEQADKAFRKLINLARDVRAAWPWAAHDLSPALLADAAIVAAVKHELFRCGGRPALGGGQDKPGSTINFPGGVSPRLELTGMPDRVTPLSAVAREASALASTVMRSGKSTGAIPVQVVNGNELAPRQRTAAEEQLAALHKRQAELAADPNADEAVYQSVVAEIAVAAAAVDAERTGAQP
jgi:hypothetical protein